MRQLLFWCAILHPEVIAGFLPQMCVMLHTCGHPAPILLAPPQLASGDSLAYFTVQVVAGIVALRSLRSWFLEHDEEAAHAFERLLDGPYEVEKVCRIIQFSVHVQLRMRNDCMLMAKVSCDSCCFGSAHSHCVDPRLIHLQRGYQIVEHYCTCVQRGEEASEYFRRDIEVCKVWL